MRGARLETGFLQVSCNLEVNWAHACGAVPELPVSLRNEVPPEPCQNSLKEMV